MTCRDFQQHLEHCVEHRHRPEIARFESHLAQCGQCREEWETFRLLQSAVSHLTELDQVPDLADRVVSSLHGPSAASSHPAPSRNRFRWAGFAAAIVAVAVLAMIVLPGVIGLLQDEPLVVQQEDEPSQLVIREIDRSPEPGVRLNQIFTETGGAVSSLLRETGGTIDELKTLLPRRAAEEAPREEESRLALHLQKDLQPLGRQLRDSMSFLIRTPAAP